MSDKAGNGEKSGASGRGRGSRREPQSSHHNDFTFNPSNTEGPSLRKPQLSGPGLQAAIELNFDDTYVPSSVTGGDKNSFISSDRSNNRQQQAVINNHSNSSHHMTNSGAHNQSPLFVDNYGEGLSQQQLEELLAPLRRPDANQLPPDVLAVLLKSSRFEQIYLPTQNRHTENFTNVSSQQRSQVSETTNHPERGAFDTNSNNFMTNPNRQPPSGTRQTVPKFNPLAQEFVPYSPSCMDRQQHDLAYAMSQIQFQNNSSEPFILEDDFEGSDNSDRILSSITDMVNQVAMEPGSLTRCSNSCVAILKKDLNDEDILGIAITLLTEEMIANKNFCFSGAKILDIFHKNDIKVGNKTIKNLLLTRMKEEFDSCVKNLADPEVRNRSLGVLRLLSDLYMNFGVLANDSKINIIGLAALELMLKLVQSDKSIETVQCVCQLLKLIGWELETTKSNAKIQEYIGLVFNELELIHKSTDKNLNTRCISMCDMIIKLRANKWNREQEESAPAATQTSSELDFSQQAASHSHYYELPDTVDEYYEIDGEIMIDDEPEDVQAAYEEFLRELNEANE